MIVISACPIAKKGYEKWLFVEWLYPGMHRIAAVRQLRAVEKEIREKNLKGWLMESAKDHTKMHPIIEKLGGVKYAEDEESYFYKKEVK